MRFRDEGLPRDKKVLGQMRLGKVRLASCKEKGTLKGELRILTASLGNQSKKAKTLFMSFKISDRGVVNLYFRKCWVIDDEASAHKASASAC